MAERIVTCDLHIEKETLQIFSACLISALCVRPLWHGRRQADNPFPPVSAAACHDRFKMAAIFVFAAQADPVVESVERHSP